MGGGLNSAFCKLFAIFFLLFHHAVRFPVIPQRIASRGTSEADLRTDGAKLVRIANGTSRLVRKHYRRDSVSVEQIQDARDEQQSTETVSFRCCCERCRLSRAIFKSNTPEPLLCGISKHKLNTCDKTYKSNKGGLMNRIIVQYKLLRRIAWKII